MLYIFATNRDTLSRLSENIANIKCVIKMMCLPLFGCPLKGKEFIVDTEICDNSVDPCSSAIIVLFQVEQTVQNTIRFFCGALLAQQCTISTAEIIKKY